MRLPEEVERGAVFPLWDMDTNFVHRHPEPPDTRVCGPHQSDGGPTLDVSAHPRVGLPPLCFKATGYSFQGGRCLRPHQTVNGGNEEREVSPLLEASLQINLLVSPL